MADFIIFAIIIILFLLLPVVTYKIIENLKIVLLVFTAPITIFLILYFAQLFPVRQLSLLLGFITIIALTIKVFRNTISLLKEKYPEGERLWKIRFVFFYFLIYVLLPLLVDTIILYDIDSFTDGLIRNYL
mgnify:CR=1 FL=1